MGTTSRFNTCNSAAAGAAPPEDDSTPISNIMSYVSMGLIFFFCPDRLRGSGMFRRLRSSGWLARRCFGRRRCSTTFTWSPWNGSFEPARVRKVRAVNIPHGSSTLPWSARSAGQNAPAVGLATDH